MLVSESLGFVDSDWTTDFRNQLNKGASQYADLSVSGDGHPAGQTKCWIESVRMISLQNLDWRLEFYSKSLGTATVCDLNPNNNNLLGWVNFFASGTSASNTAVVQEYSRIATTYAATLFAYFAQGLKIPYEDKQPSLGGAPAGGKLHLNLVNLNGTAKNPGDSGLVHIRCGIISAA